MLSGKMNNLYENCNLCPRHCGANRSHGNVGYCGMSSELKIARAALHHWEEPCISGENGSGTVFFCGCSLKCIYCQNHNIALGDNCGKTVTIRRLADIFIELQDKKAHNINIVTGTHYTPSIVSAIDIARTDGLKIPVVYNTSGYETEQNIKLLNGYVDVYLPDFKYIDSEKSSKYSHAANYPEVALAAIESMLKQVGTPVFDNDGIITKGVIVRHLVLPGNIKASKLALKTLYNAFGDDIYISIMKQYTPMPHIMKFSDEYRELKRKLTSGEYNAVVNYACDIGITKGFIQSGENASESFIPEFDNEGV